MSSECSADGINHQTQSNNSSQIPESENRLITWIATRNIPTRAEPPRSVTVSVLIPISYCILFCYKFLSSVLSYRTKRNSLHTGTDRDSGGCDR